MQLTIDESIAINREVIFKDIEGETVLLDLDRGTYFGLDAVGTRVWQTLVEHGRARPAIAALLEEFDVTADILERDIVILLGELRANDLIRPQS